MQAFLENFWKGDTGAKRILQVAIPLILSTASHSLLLFFDSIFLMWDSPDAMAASVQGGIISYTLLCFFLAIGAYTNVFIAQYTGANKDHWVGPALWQGIYFCLFSTPVLLSIYFFCGEITTLVGHSPNIKNLEFQYLQIICFVMPFTLLAECLSCFFTGRGKTRAVMYINLGCVAINILLDYILIFGKFGLPQMGIRGAAWGTFIATFLMFLLYIILIFRKSYQEKYHIFNKQFNPKLFFRMMRFGFPSGVQCMLDLFAFSVFMALVGRLGPEIMAAATMTLRINLFAFLPMIGMGVAVSTLVGQAMGSRQIAKARRITWNACILSLLFMGSISIIYVFAPDVFLSLFSSDKNEIAFNKIHDTAVTLLQIVAIYCIFDSLYIVLSFALKGAGDTKFVLIVSPILHWVGFVLPTWLLLNAGFGVYAAWWILGLFIALLTFIFFLRFRFGPWHKISLIQS